MSILKLVRNFALLAVLALAAHQAAARSYGNHSHSCGAPCDRFNPCRGGCTCSGIVGVCVPHKSH
jgi:hypothetical protein